MATKTKRTLDDLLDVAREDDTPSSEMRFAQTVKLTQPEHEMLRNHISALRYRGKANGDDRLKRASAQTVLHDAFLRYMAEQDVQGKKRDTLSVLMAQDQRIKDLEKQLAVYTDATAKRPAVPVDESIQPDCLVCLECGEKVRSIRKHLSYMHDLTWNQYKTKWDLPPDYPLTAPEFSKAQSEISSERMRKIWAERKAKGGQS